MLKPPVYTTLMNNAHFAGDLPVSEIGVVRTREMLARRVVIYDTTESGKHLQEASDCPFLVPPFSAFWVEGGLSNRNPKVCWGAMVEIDERGGGWLWWNVHAWIKNTERVYAVGRDVFATKDGIEVPGQRTVGGWLHHPVHFHFPRKAWADSYHGSTDDQIDRDFGNSQLCNVTAHVIAAIGSLSYANSVAVRQQMDAELVRKTAKYGGDTDRVHTISVSVGVAKNRRVLDLSQAGKGGVMPLHKCRGHIARYGPKWGNGLLFGKYEGEYVIPSCVKGKKSNGETHPNYCIKAPAPTAVTHSI